MSTTLTISSFGHECFTWSQRLLRHKTTLFCWLVQAIAQCWAGPGRHYGYLPEPSPGHVHHTLLPEILNLHPLSDWVPIVEVDSGTCTTSPSGKGAPLIWGTGWKFCMTSSPGGVLKLTLANFSQDNIYRVFTPGLLEEKSEHLHDVCVCGVCVCVRARSARRHLFENLPQ